MLMRVTRMILAVIVAAVVLAVVGFRTLEEPGLPQLPGQLAEGIVLEDVFEGDEALSRLGELPAGVLGIVAGSPEEVRLGQYSRGVWLLMVKAGSCTLLDMLVEHLNNTGGESPLTQPLERVFESGGPYYIVLGKLDSSIHVLWCHGGSLLWLRTPAVAPSAIVEGLLRSLPPEPLS